MKNGTAVRSRPPARTRGLKLALVLIIVITLVASSREDAWIETLITSHDIVNIGVASSREDAWIETVKQHDAR